jgi:hypothetical protein
MADSIESIDRFGRFVERIEEADQELKESREVKLLVTACQELAPLFDCTAQEIGRAWHDCEKSEENSAEAFREEMKARGMSCVVAAVPPNSGKTGRPRQVAFEQLIVNIRKTWVWRQFIKNVRESDGLIMLVFRPANKKKTWVLTNMHSATKPRNFFGRIVIPVKGAPDVVIMPLAAYVEETK